MKKLIVGILIFISMPCLFIISGEIAIRIFHYMRYTSKNNSIHVVTFDHEVGWIPAPNYIFKGNKIDASGTSYVVTITTDKHGFRRFGNPEEKEKKKVFFLGDSFTHALQASDNKTYYGLLGTSLPIEVFAFGVDGYGTLQETMILERFYDKIQPDIIIFQFCGNDFINNSYELELKSTRNNNGMRRPYFTETAVIYKTPKPLPFIHDFINTYSRFLCFTINRFDQLKARHLASVEDCILADDTHTEFKTSVAITEQIVQNMRKHIPSSTDIYAFSVDDTFPFYDAFKNIAGRNNIHFIDGIPQAIRSAEQRGLTTRFADNAHWNETGHQIAAKVLRQYIAVNW